MSVAITRAPSNAICMDTKPVPAPTSNTKRPDRDAALWKEKGESQALVLTEEEEEEEAEDEEEAEEEGEEEEISCLSRSAK